MATFEDPSLIEAIKAASSSGTADPREVANRAEVLEQVFFDSDPTWFRPFMVMLVLAAGVAAVGLAQDSGAVVIGSMVINPLGSPIAALGGALALGWPREILRSLATVAISVMTVAGVGFIVGLFLSGAALNDQILARTDPDLRDLAVAMFAGGAAGYARTRRELSSTLVGVAIAVAVVPPLAAVGLLLEDGRPLLARGALMLFATNLVGISLAVTVVMLALNYAPRPRLPRTTAARALTVGLVIGAIVVVVPLYNSYSRLSDAANLRADVTSVVISALGPNTSVKIVGVYFTTGAVEVDLSNTNSFFDADALVRQITSAVDGTLEVTVKTL